MTSTNSTESNPTTFRLFHVIKGLEKSLAQFRAVSNQHKVHAKVWKGAAMALRAGSVTIEGDIDSKINNISGMILANQDDLRGLSYIACVFSAISYSLYPDDSFDEFLHLVPEALKVHIEEYGIDYRIISKKDTTKDSGYEHGNLIYADLEGWYESSARIREIWNMLDGDQQEQMHEALDRLGDYLVREVKDWMRLNWDMTVKDIYAILNDVETKI